MANAEPPSSQPPAITLEELDKRYQRARQALASGQLDEAEAAIAAHEHGAQALIEELRQQQAELETQNEELRNTRYALEETLERFSAFFQALPIAALIIAERGEIREANPAAEALFNLPGSDRSQISLSTLVAEPCRDTLCRALRAWSEERQATTLTEVGLRPVDRGALVGDIQLVPLPGVGAAERQFICTVIDHTESVRHRRRLLEQRAQLEAIFQAAPVGIVFARARRMLHFNSAWSDLVGYSPEQLEQQDTRMLYADDDEYARVGQTLYGQMQREGRGRLETRFRHKAGHWLDVVLCAAPIEEDSADDAWVVTILDITRRKTAEQALQEREERLRLTLEATNDGLWDLDLRCGRIVANERFSTMLGYAPGELELRMEPLLTMIHPDDQPLLQARLEQHLLADAPYVLDFRMRCHDGSWRWLQTRGKVVARDADDQPLRVVGTHTDIHALTESTRRLREAERLAALGHWDYDTATSTLTGSQELYRIFGLDPTEPLPRIEDLAQLFHPDDAPELLHRFHDALESGRGYLLNLRLVRRDGALRWLSVAGRTERDETGRVVRCFGTAQDVTEREQAQERLRETAQVFERTADGVIVAGADHRIIAVNPAFTQITGYDEDEVSGLTVEAVLASSADRAFWEPTRVPPEQDRGWPDERWEHRQDGSLYRARLSITEIRDQRDQLERYLIIISDTTPLHRTRQQVEFLSQFDPLTGLGNRSRFRTRLAQLLQRAEQGAGPLAILIVDLDRFRVVNESLGQLAADDLLKQLASALSEVVRPMDTLARLGGDEFGLILPAIDAREPVTTVAERLQQRCAEPRIVDGQRVTLTASVGIAVYPLDGRSDDVLMRHADIALKQAKARGRQRVQRFQHPAAHSPPDRLRVEACLSQAMLNDELQLHYQPQVQLGDGRLIGAEALLRWHSAELGPISPQHFIPIAEDMGLIHKIGRWVLQQAAQQLAAWDRHGQRLPRVAVNLSILQLEDPELVSTIAAILQQHRLDPDRLELELTESLLMRQGGQAVSRLDALRQFGVRLAIDDFGTGYSSLAYLHRLPMHQLKIDRSFIDPLPDDPHSQTITNAIVALGKSLGTEVLAEGVETAEQAAWLRDAGCVFAQGYHYSLPLAPQAFAAQWL